MKGFIKVTQIDKQTTYINISNIVKFYRSGAEETKIVLINSDEIKTKHTLEELEKLIYNASTF